MIDNGGLSRKLWVQLASGFLLVTWVTLAAVALLVRSSVQNSFGDYVTQRDASNFSSSLIEDLQAHFIENQTWEGVGLVLLDGRGGGSGQGGGQGSGGDNERRGVGGVNYFIAGVDHMIIAATQADWIGLDMDTIGPHQTLPLSVDDVQVGYLGEQALSVQNISIAETEFLDETLQWLMITAVGAGLVALVAGIGLAWRLTRPLHQLTIGVNSLSTGELGQQVLVDGAEEMRVLAQAFNMLSRRLAEVEQARQNMSSDIAHELRSPVSVLRGHLEGMMDGVYPLDSAHVAVAYDQTLHLARLVEDLRLLTQAEAGRLSLDRQTIQPGLLVEQTVVRFEPLVQDAEFAFSHTIAPNLPEIWVDSGRMQQVFDNLLANALRHTTPGGEIAITVDATGDGVRYQVSNSGSIDPAQLTRIFERFWRADEARRRDAGGIGLGLAITQQLVLLHGGRIWVEANNGQTHFMIELPKQP